MKSELIIILLGFFEGFTLILSPCVLSILPIILAGSLAGSKKRSLGIILGFVLTFTLFAWFARLVTHYLGLDLNWVRYTAYVFLLLFSIILFSDYLTKLFNQLTQRMAGIGSIFVKSPVEGSGFFKGLGLGSLVGILWTPCAGPILSAIIIQIAIQKTTFFSFLTLMAFTFGSAFPMLIIAMYGVSIRDTFPFFQSHSVLIRKILGLVIILNIIYMVSLERGGFSVTAGHQSGIRTAQYLEKGLWHPYPAPPIAGIETWINSQPLQWSVLKGKVVLLDFWTYSCINCIRTLPYLKRWYEQYHNRGLVIIGIHAPEFDFEKKVENVANAVKNYGIHYPVALDNSFVTWQNFSNHFWPAHYLVNPQGQVVYEHLGEGDYEVMENNIRFLLKIDLTKMPVDLNPPSASHASTPETYLGYARANSKLSPDLIRNRKARYHFPEKLLANAWGLQGDWLVKPDKIHAVENHASLKIHFHARKVFIVMGNNTKKPILVKLLLNDKPLLDYPGKKVVNGSILVDKYSLYEVIASPLSIDGILQITPKTPGLEVYTFTFGD